MKASAIVDGKVVTFELSRGLAAAHRRNKGRAITAAEAIFAVEAKRRDHARRRASAYIESRP